MSKAVNLASLAPNAPNLNALASNVFPQITGLTVGIASNALTTSMTPGLMNFRSSTLTSGVVTAIIQNTPISLTIPSGATLGSISAQQSIFVWAVLYNGGIPVLAVSNLSGTIDMSETGLITSTAISSGATSAGVWYSVAAITNSPYRVVGITIQTEATAGTYATAPSLAQGIGGEAFTALMSAGYGQNWVSYARAINTVYYNISSRTRWTCPVISGTASGTGTATFFVWNAQSAVYVQAACLSTFGGGSYCGFPIPVPAGASYYLGPIIGSAVYSSWTEFS